MATIAVNGQTQQTKANYMHIRLSSYGNANGISFRGTHHCCDTRNLIDPAIDKYKIELISHFGSYNGRDVRCIINGWKSC